MSIPSDNSITPIDWKKRIGEEQSYGDPIPIESSLCINALLSLNEIAAVFVIGLFTLGIGILTGISLAHRMEEEASNDK